MKLAVLSGLFLLLHHLAGRIWAFALLGVMTLGMIALHGYWFQYLNGIHWRTAEPRDKYLRLIGKP